MTAFVPTRAEGLHRLAAFLPAAVLPPLPDGRGKPSLLLVTPEDLCPERMWVGSDVRAGLPRVQFSTVWIGEHRNRQL